MKDVLEFPLVSIIVVNHDGKDYLSQCLGSIQSLDYSQEKIEIIIVDNGSRDSSVDLIRSQYKQVKIIRNDRNTGFAAANNQAAKTAKGKYLAFLNNDTMVDARWLIELLKPIYKDKETVASGSKVLSMDGKKVDFGGGMINFEGKGFQIDYGLPVKKDRHYQYKYLPFVNGGAMMINRDIFLEVGGFDSDFFAYYEDVDLGWRLWVLGYKVVFAPKSIVYHHHHGTSRKFSEDKLRFLKERNSLYSIFKNYDDINLSRAFSGTLANIFNRVFVDVHFDYKKFYDLSGDVEVKDPEVSISKEPLSSLAAARNFFDELPSLVKKRQEIQSKRKRDDKAVFSYFKAQFMPVSSDPEYQKNHSEILKNLGIHKVFEKDIRRSLVIISGEVVSNTMAGPAIRMFNFAKVLSEHMDVMLAIPNETDLPEQCFKMVRYRDDGSLKQILSQADLVLCNGMMLSKYDSIKESKKYLIIDIYDPYNLATLAEQEGQNMKERLEVHSSIQKYFNEQFYYGDFFICASERQRDFWLGMLAALNRVNPFSYNIDPSLKRMIDIVPFGLPSNKPLHTSDVLKDKVKGISRKDFVVIWGGGIYNWLDPLTLIEAMETVYQKNKSIKLYFMGIKHPNPEVKELDMVGKTVKLARKLGIEGKNVFFNFDWVDYDSRQNYLLEADAGIITHPGHVETRFSFRTRVLDYLWTGLPIISTEGDHLSDMVKIDGLGIVAKVGSSEELAKAVLKMAGDKKFYNRCIKNIEQKEGDFTWEKVCRPIIDFCRDPVSNALKANDLEDSTNSQGDQVSKGSGRRLINRFFYHLFHSGPGKTARYVSNCISHKQTWKDKRIRND